MVGVFAIGFVMSGTNNDRGFFGFYGLLFAVGTLVTLVSWRTARRAQGMSEDPTAAAGTAPESSMQRAMRIPPLEVSSCAPNPVSDSQIFEVTSRSNVFARPPWNIAYLRLFDNEDRLQAFLAGPWREFGYVHFIRAATSVKRAELHAAKEHQPVFIASRAQLLAELGAEAIEPAPWGPRQQRLLAERRKRMRTTGITSPGADAGPRPRARPSWRTPISQMGLIPGDEIYPTRALLCHGTFWKSALDVLLERMDVVVLDLSGYQRKNVGTGYELQRVIDRFPIDDCIVLADEHSDLEFLEAQIRQAWSQMADGSPNAGEEPRRVLIARTARPSGGKPRSFRRQRRSETLALGAILQRRQDEAKATRSGRFPSHGEIGC